MFREFEHRLSPSMRQNPHVAGDKAFVDFSGKKIPIIDAATGVVPKAEIFVSVLGALVQSHLCGGNLDAGLAGLDWRACADVPVLGCEGPVCWCPTISRAALQGPSFYDPESNRSYGAMAAHYGVGILATTPYRPKDESKS